MSGPADGGSGIGMNEEMFGEKGIGGALDFQSNGIGFIVCGFIQAWICSQGGVMCTQSHLCLSSLNNVQSMVKSLGKFL